ncbi:MAG: hypothetical protein RLZ91_1534, partial [Bacteroidota bacterium]
MTLRFTRLLALLFVLGSLHQQTLAQTVNYIINPNTDGGFEGAHGWTFLNGIQANQWQVGAAVKSAGSSGAYVSNNANTQALTSPQAGSSIVYMYKDIVVPSNATSIQVSFKWKNPDGSSFPPRVLFLPATDLQYLPTGGDFYRTNSTAFATFLQNQSSWQTYTNSNPLQSDRDAIYLTYGGYNLKPGTTYRIVFEWAAWRQNYYTQNPPICTLPTSATIVATGNNVVYNSNNVQQLTPNTDYTYRVDLPGGGSNYLIEWNVQYASIIAGQGTQNVTVRTNSSLPSGTFSMIGVKVYCPTPTYTFGGYNGGNLAIDEVAVSYVAAPIITTISTTSGSVGSSVTLNGQFFGDDAAHNIVYLGGLKCTITAATSTSITVTIPARAKFDHFSVVNTATNLTAYSQMKFLPVNTIISGAKYSALGNTSFLSPITFTVQLAGNPSQRFSIVDIDQDGKPDIASYSTAGVPQVLRNTATSGVVNSSTFAAVSAVTGVTETYSPNSSKSVMAADLNNDGKVDLATSNGVSATGAFANMNSSTSGSITLDSYRSIKASNGDYFVDAAMISLDMNNDGKLDIFGLNGQSIYDPTIGFSYQSGYYLTQNTSTGNTFTSVTGKSSNAISCKSCTDYLLVGPMYAADRADLNGDGKIDIVVGGSSINILNNTTNPGSLTLDNFKYDNTFIRTNGSSGIINSVKIVDFDGDGRLDIVYTNSTAKQVSVLRNTYSATGTLSFADPINFSTPDLVNTYMLAIGDMNGDSKPDILVSDYSTTSGFATKIAYFENSSSVGTINFYSEVLVATTANRVYHQFEVTDVDGDNKRDIVASQAGGNIDVYRNMTNEAGVIYNDQTICSGATPAAFTSLSAASYTGGTLTYKWQKSTDGINFTDIPSATALTYTSPSLTQTTWFRRGVTNPGDANNYYFTAPRLVTVLSLPTVDAVVAGERCGTNGTVTLSATASAGASINWYNTSTGGTLLSGNSTFVTPSISSSTTYYAEAVGTLSCKSATRTPVLATVQTLVPALPTLSSAAALTRCDAGSVTITATGGAGITYNWYNASTGGTLLGTGSSFV